jgi:hypothetical protein
MSHKTEGITSTVIDRITILKTNQRAASRDERGNVTGIYTLKFLRLSAGLTSL